MNKPFVKTVLVILMSIICAAQARAFPVVSLVPSNPFVEGPGSFSISVNIGNLKTDDPSRLLGAFSLDLLFDPAVLTFLPFPADYWGGALGDVAAGEALANIDLSTPGMIRISEVSLLEGNPDTCLLCTGPYLKDLQGNSLNLATFRFFTAATSGSTQLELVHPLFVDANGFPIPLDRLSGATVHIPEPGNLAMVGLGAVLMSWLRRRKLSPSA